jgi:hypothetical protein
VLSPISGTSSPDQGRGAALRGRDRDEVRLGGDEPVEFGSAPRMVVDEQHPHRTATPHGVTGSRTVVDGSIVCSTWHGVLP